MNILKKILKVISMIIGIYFVLTGLFLLCSNEIGGGIFFLIVGVAIIFASHPEYLQKISFKGKRKTWN